MSEEEQKRGFLRKVFKPIYWLKEDMPLIRKKLIEDGTIDVKHFTSTKEVIL